MTLQWPIRPTWRAAVEVTATAYWVDQSDLLAPSRGRGPRPPERIWEAKKMAVHLTVLVSACSYAALAREIGFHKDTITSQCADMRDRVLDDDAMEAKSAALEALIRWQLQSVARERVDSLRAQLALLEASTSGLIMGELPPPAWSPASSVTHPSLHPTLSLGHANVIEIDKKSRKA